VIERVGTWASVGLYALKSQLSITGVKGPGHGTVTVLGRSKRRSNPTLHVHKYGSRWKIVGPNGTVLTGLKTKRQATMVAGEISYYTRLKGADHTGAKIAKFISHPRNGYGAVDMKLVGGSGVRLIAADLTERAADALAVILNATIPKKRKRNSSKRRPAAKRKNPTEAHHEAEARQMMVNIHAWVKRRAPTPHNVQIAHRMLGFLSGTMNGWLGSIALGDAKGRAERAVKDFTAKSERNAAKGKRHARITKSKRSTRRAR
jgi:hypothetical protein